MDTEIRVAVVFYCALLFTIWRIFFVKDDFVDLSGDPYLTYGHYRSALSNLAWYLTGMLLPIPILPWLYIEFGFQGVVYGGALLYVVSSRFAVYMIRRTTSLPKEIIAALVFLEPYRGKTPRVEMDVESEGTGRFTSHHWTQIWAAAETGGIHLNFDHSSFFLPWQVIPDLGKTNFKAAGSEKWQSGLVIPLPTIIDTQILVPWDEEGLSRVFAFASKRSEEGLGT